MTEPVSRSLAVAIAEAEAAYQARLASGVEREGPPEEDEYEKGLRAVHARAMRQSLPPFLRTGTRAELEQRLRGSLLPFARAVPAASCLLLGPTACGKTTAAALAFLTAVGRGVKLGGEAWKLAGTCRWHDASELARARRQHPLGDGDAPQVDQAYKASLLFLDDLGQERFDDGTLRDVMNARYERQLPTIATSGLREAELQSRYDAHFLRRILQGGQIIDLFGG